jgi:hypothetical protein
VQRKRQASPTERRVAKGNLVAHSGTATKVRTKKSIKSIALKGGGLSDLVPELRWMIAILCVLLTVSTLRFRKKLA